MAPGQPLVKTGGCVSLTFTTKLQLAFGDTPLLAVHITVVVPTGKLDPDAGEQMVLATAQLSLVVGANVAGAEH